MKPKKEIIDLITANNFEDAKSALTAYVMTDATGDDFGRHLQEAADITAASCTASPSEALKIQAFYAAVEQQAMQVMTTNPTQASLLCRIRSTAIRFPEVDLSDAALEQVRVSQQHATPFAQRAAAREEQQEQKAGYSWCPIQ